MTFDELAYTDSVPERKAGLRFVYILVLMNTITIGIVNPVFPFLLKEIGGLGDGGGAKMLGVFAFGYAMMTFLFAPLFACLSDRFGRRPLLLLATFGLAIDYIIIALAQSVEMLLFGRLLAGIVASSQSAAGAFVADVSRGKDISRNFGIFQAVATAGLALGPAIGGLLGSYDLRAPFWVAAVVVLLNGILGVFTLRESLPVERRAAVTWKSASPIGPFYFLFRHQHLLVLCFVFLIMQVAGASFMSIVQFYTHYRYGWGPGEVAIYLMVMSAGVAIVQSTLVSHLCRKMGDHSVLRLGLGISIISYFLCGIAQNWLLFWFALVPSVLSSIMYPTLTAIFTRKVSDKEQGQLHGMFAVLVAVGGMTGPVAFGFIFAWAIGPAHTPGYPGIPMIIGSLLMILCLSLIMKRSVPSLTHED